MKNKYNDIVILTLVAIPLRIFKISAKPVVRSQMDTLILTSMDTSLNRNFIWLLNHPWAEPHPPLFYLFVVISRQILGDTAFAIRLPAVIAGVLSVPILYSLGYEYRDRRLGIYVGIIAAFAPYLITWSRQARMYSQLGFFTALAFLLLVQLHKRDISFRLGGAYILALTGVLYTHVFGVFVLLSHMIIILIWESGNLNSINPHNFWIKYKHWLIMLGISALLSIPWGLVLFIR